MVSSDEEKLSQRSETFFSKKRPTATYSNLQRPSGEYQQVGPAVSGGRSPAVAALDDTIPYQFSRLSKPRSIQLSRSGSLNSYISPSTGVRQYPDEYPAYRSASSGLSRPPTRRVSPMVSSNDDGDKDQDDQAQLLSRRPMVRR